MLRLMGGGDAMNPMPPTMPLAIPLSVHALLDILLVLTIAALVVIAGMAVRDIGRAYFRRERLVCPVRQRRVQVLFRLWPDGARADVIRCSVFGRGAVTCGKVCLQA
jgi:hypothetical protein